MDTRTGKIHHLTNEILAGLSGEDQKYLIPLDPTPKQLKGMKVGRNDLCPCGSGKKFKKCHLGKEV